MRGLFDLVNNRALYKKLEYEYNLLKDTPNNAYYAYNFFVTAWHLLEWIFPDKIENGKSVLNQERGKIRDQTPLLKICEHLAIGAKHFVPTRGKHKSIQDTYRNSVWAPEVWADGVWAKDVWKDELVIKLSGDEKQVFGDEITVKDLSSKIMEYWKDVYDNNKFNT